MVQLSHPYITTGKTTAVTTWTFVNKVMSLLFNTLCRFVIGERNGNPVQYSCLDNPKDRGAWWDRGVHGIAESDMTKQLTLSLSYPYLTTGKTIALTIQNFVSKVMPLLFNNTI